MRPPWRRRLRRSPRLRAHRPLRARCLLAHSRHTLVTPTTHRTPPAIYLDLSERADLTEFPELLDRPCPYPDLRLALRDLARINRLTLAYRPTLTFLSALYRTLPLQPGPLHIVDVGCGSGDMLRRVRRWAADHNLPVRLTGIDLNPDVIRAAREVTLPGTVTFLETGFQSYAPDPSIDIVVSSLLTHHLPDPEIIQFLRWMESQARLGWFINDLHRQPIPFTLFSLAARLSPWHPLIQHDGPVSILRSFRPADWHRLLAAANLPPTATQIQGFFPARLCIARRR